jgi:hypothetical protein
MQQHATEKSALIPTPLQTGVAVDMIGVHKWFGDFHVLRDINLRVSKRRIVSELGTDRRPCPLHQPAGNSSRASSLISQLRMM